MKDLGVVADPLDVVTKGYVDTALSGTTTVLTSSGTAVANSLIVTNIAAGGNITLPAAPPDGTFVRLFRLGGTGFQSVTSGVGDSVYPSTNSSLLVVGMGYTFQYQASSKTWYPSAVSWSAPNLGPPSSSNTQGTMMARDTTGRSQVADPALAQDIATKNYVDAVPGIKNVTTLTGTATATANTFHLVNLASGLGAQPITLPAAPPQGTTCEFIRQDTNIITTSSSIAPAAGDTILGTSPYVLGGSQTGAKFVYVGTVWVVHEASIGGNLSGYFAQRSAYQNGFNPSIMARDSAGRSQVNDPAAGQDIATKNYVDAATGGPITRILFR